MSENCPRRDMPRTVLNYSAHGSRSPPFSSASPFERDESCPPHLSSVVCCVEGRDVSPCSHRSRKAAVCGTAVTDERCSDIGCTRCNFRPTSICLHRSAVGRIDIGRSSEAACRNSTRRVHGSRLRVAGDLQGRRHARLQRRFPRRRTASLSSVGGVVSCSGPLDFRFRRGRLRTAGLSCALPRSHKTCGRRLLRLHQRASVHSSPKHADCPMAASPRVSLSIVNCSVRFHFPWIRGSPVCYIFQCCNARGLPCPCY